MAAAVLHTKQHQERRSSFLSHVKITDREKYHDVFYESDGVVKI